MEKIKQKLRADWISVATIVLSLVITVVTYPAVPQRIPAHWNIQGRIDRWGDKSELFIMPIGFAVIYLLFLAFPLLDRKGGLKQRPEAYRKIIQSVMILFFAVNTLRITDALGMHLPVDRVIVVILGLFFAMMGNYLPQLKPNTFAGIRTPWTLKDDDNWRRTHRIGGFTSIIAGIIMIVCGLLFKKSAHFIALLVVVTLWSVGVVIYSYCISRNKQKNGI